MVLALIGSPELVFLDELTTGLDVAARREVWRTLRQLKEQGLTIVLTTHYMEEAEALSDRIGVMKSGKLLFIGSAEEMKAKTGTEKIEDAFIAMIKEAKQ